MRSTLQTFVLAGVLGIGSALGFGASLAKAQGFGYGGYPGGYYGGGYGGGGYYGGGYYGGGYSVPSYSYYGNGGHDAAPHGHTRQGLFGSSSYYGTGRHDFRPHGHVQTPYGITGYSNGLFNSTQSYSPPRPYGHHPW